MSTGTAEEPRPNPDRTELCVNCHEETTFRFSDGEYRCIICDTVTSAKPQSLEPEPESGTAKPLPFNDLDHLAVFLKGEWNESSLQALQEEFNEIDQAAEANGLGVKVFVIRKSPGQLAKEDNSKIMLPFRDRHGKVIISPALTLTLNRAQRRAKK